MQKRILIVDDDHENREFLAVRLAPLFAAAVAGGGAEAIDLFRRDPFPVVLADVRMPGIQGVELMRTLRAIDEKCQVILMSGYSDMEMVIEAINGGAFSFVTKPIDFTNLLARISDATAVIQSREQRDSLLREVRDELAAQTLESQRLSTVAALAGGIAHELTQPLSGIGLFNYNLKCLVEEQRPITPDHLLHVTGKIDEQLERAKGIIAHMREFISGGNAGITGRLELREAVERSLELMRHQLKSHGIVVRLELPERLDVSINRHLFEQVLVNLVANARESLEETPRPGNKKEVAIRGERQGPWVVVDVSDTGGGVADALVTTMFEPFVTSKRERGGSGLGLYLCRRLMEEMGGAITLHETSKDGTTFRMHLPVE